MSTLCARRPLHVAASAAGKVQAPKMRTSLPQWRTGMATAVATVMLAAPTAALADVSVMYGAEVFTANCASCHTGGNNVVVPEKTLRKEAIEKYLTGGLNEEAIVYQVTNGKGQMPAWGDVLDEDEIASVAKYVYQQATTNGW